MAWSQDVPIFRVTIAQRFTVFTMDYFTATPRIHGFKKTGTFHFADLNFLMSVDENPACFTMSPVSLTK